MQLILDTEATIDIKEKMTTLEESAVKDLNDAEFFENDISNGNKENIHCKGNLTNNSEDFINGDNKDEVELETSLPKEDSKLENEGEIQQNGDIDLVKNFEKKVSEVNTHKEETNSIENILISEHIVSKKNHGVSRENGEKIRETNMLDAEEKKDDMESSTLSINEHEENSKIVEKDSGSELITECEASESNTMVTELKEDIHRTLEKQSNGPTLENIGTENEERNAEDILNDTDINMDVDEDITNIANCIKVSEQSSILIASTSLAINQLDENDTYMEIDSTTVTEKDLSLVENEITPCSITEQSVKTDYKVSTNTESCTSLLQEDTTMVNDNLLIDSECAESENILNKTILECEVTDIVNEEKVTEPENVIATEKVMDVETAEAKDESLVVRDTTKVNDSLLIESECEKSTNISNKTILECDKTEIIVNEEKVTELKNETVSEKVMDVETAKENDEKCKNTVEISEISDKDDSNIENISESKGILNVKESKLVENITETGSILHVKEAKKTQNMIEAEKVLDIDETKKENENIIEMVGTLDVNKEKIENIIEMDATLDVDKSKETENIIETEAISNAEEDKKNKNIPETEKIIDDIEAKESDVIENSVKLPQSQKELEEPKKIKTKLSNTLDILSDDEEIPTDTMPKDNVVKTIEKQCINIEDDDDIMLIDEDSSSKDINQDSVHKSDFEAEKQVEKKEDESKVDLEPKPENKETFSDTLPEEKVSSDTKVESSNLNVKKDTEKEELTKESIEKPIINKPLLPENFLKTHKKSLTDMTRDELEEFCILKIVESIVDRSNLSEIKSKLKSMAQNIDEYKKKAMMLTKQNRDLQVVLKSVQEEQKKKSDTAITPLKITRSVGMQVIMQEKIVRKKSTTNNANNAANNKNVRAPIQSPRQQKQAATANQQIPVPRLVPAHGPAAKPIATPQPPAVTNQNKTPSPIPNGVRLPAQKTAEKRPHTRLQSVTVDLTDDEPPTKFSPRMSPAPPVRLVSPQNLLAPQRQPFGQSLNSPRKVYIPISGPQNQNIRPGQTIMLKSLPAPRQRCPTPQMTRMPQNAVRMARVQNRHPAPLPDAMKQYQPPNWKALPPAPDLKLSKVENGIVISWKIEGYQEDSYEEIASYQLYAYQETSSPPSTALWKKIGDVKALPLPMACTLTQFMAGFKYYFAVRAVDVRSRVGPFSLPGSILLLNKM